VPVESPTLRPSSRARSEVRRIGCRRRRGSVIEKPLLISPRAIGRPATSTTEAEAEREVLVALVGRAVAVEARGAVSAIAPSHGTAAQSPMMPIPNRRAHSAAKQTRPRALRASLAEEHGGLGLGIMGMCRCSVSGGEIVRSAPLASMRARPTKATWTSCSLFRPTAVGLRMAGPLARAEITSGFSMTEPRAGRRPDPSTFNSVARKTASRGSTGPSVPTGRRRRVVPDRDGAHVAGRSRAARRCSCSTATPEGVGSLRFPVMMPASCSTADAELRFPGVKVGKDAILGDVGRRLSACAQARLAPHAHSLHAAGSAVPIARSRCVQGYVVTRESFRPRRLAAP